MESKFLLLFHEWKMKLPRGILPMVLTAKDGPFEEPIWLFGNSTYIAVTLTKITTPS
jgi:hypothetical protein